ncbi:PHD finger protein 24-like [Lytechinus variegatus]|uniref:PHD finger protein 24-like n=1 Tax=Lytechinus variegatus TaxID=7654 RepID=UPI001BB12C87|nr:PHD finger protein 24-like [Lytechinus variegatus]
MGNAVMKYRKERIQKRAQQAGRIGLIANVFLSAGKKGAAPITAAGATPFDTGQSRQQDGTTTTSSATATDSQNADTAKGNTTGTSSSWMRPFQKINRHSDQPKEPTQISYNEQRSERQAERQKLALEEARYGTAPANLEYESMLESDIDVNCALCNMVKNDVIHECRICGRCSHQKCLESGGYCSDVNFATALKNSEEEVGWSCSECESIGNLITLVEMDELMEKFDRYDRDEDSKISWADYRAVETSSVTESNAKEKFFQYDTDGDGIVSWEDYLLVEALDILEKQPQVQLMMFLVPKEIERIKNCFRMKDDHNTGVISVAAAAEAYSNWLTAQGLESSQEGRNAQEQMYNPSNKRKLISWERFIRQHALAILSARPNTATITPYIRGHPSTGL